MSNYRGQAVTLVLAGIVAVATAACDKSSPETKTEQASKTEAKSPPAEAPAAKNKDAASDRAALASYESVRASLAKDAVAATTAGAASLEKSARTAARAASGDASHNWKLVADAAKRLHDMPKDDADAVRKAFGDVSQHLVAVLAADRALAEGLHVFECPMAQGYKKWVQPAAKIENPYMGTRMPECGSESSL